MPTTVRSFSKINLGLAIGPLQPDGYHQLTTLYQTLALHDIVTVEAKLLPAGGPSRIGVTSNHPDVPQDPRNTAWRMAERALAQTGVSAQVHIHIHKELPLQGGLGAGSANAAAALNALQRELHLMVPGRLGLAAEVGSDVPLFFVGGAVLGTGRGEQVEALPDLPRTWCVVAVPDIGVSTPHAFQEWDGLCAARASGGLTSPSQPDRLKWLSHVYASVFGANPVAERAFDASGIVRGPWIPNPETKQGEAGEGTQNGLAGNTLLALVRTGIENDFEQVVFPQYPLLREIKRLLIGTPADGRESPSDGSGGNALYASLSGSGSALFGLYASQADAEAAQQRVQASGCKALLTETLPRAEYWATMFAE